MRKPVIFSLVLLLFIEANAYAGQLEVDALHAKWSAAAPLQRAELQKQLDQLCAQKDCHASRLFWFTDLERAKEAAQLEGKPILSLHLLGRLDEEMSCANSRFFRTLLYSDPRIAAVLRDRFVLHWHSVRDVPRVTIELGDGRVIRQTITGNSAHYLLDENGKPLDVLPGLYSPDAFRAQLETWVSLHRTLQTSDFAGALRAHHQLRFTLALSEARDLGIDESMYEGLPAVWAAQLRSQSKRITEAPLLRQLRGERRGPANDPWQAIGEQRKSTVRFSDETLALMRSKQPITEALLDNLRRTVAADTTFNEYDLHLRVHDWFARGEVGDLYSLNERVYDQLFLTPSSDPWLGLMPEAAFTGIEELTAPRPEIGL